MWLYFVNKLTGATQWCPPPPSDALPTDATSPQPKDVASPSTKNPGAVGCFVSPPPAEAYAKELLGEEAEEPVEEETAEVEGDVAPSEPTPAQLTFTGLVPVRLYMKPRGDQTTTFPDNAREIGVNPDGLMRQQLTQAMRRHFIDVVHGGDKQSYLASDCFKDT